MTLEKFKKVSTREKSPNQTKYQYPNDCKGLPLTEMGYLDANNLENPQNFKQVKKISNASKSPKHINTIAKHMSILSAEKSLTLSALQVSICRLLAKAPVLY